MHDWDIEKARETYNIRHWSSGYFDINDQGNVCAIPVACNNNRIDLFEIVNEINQAGLSTPVLVRFTDILHDRVNRLRQAFNEAMQAEQYQGSYTSVYPIKVNQQQSVVRELLNADQGHTGLEAGSKPELMAVLALSRKPDNIIICNGYKDREYIRLALIGKLLGNRVFIVIEKQSELDLVLAESGKLGIEPAIGLRLRLSSIGSGRWQNTGGEKSKFGLSAPQAASVIQQLNDNGKLSCLQLLHFHMGSQLPNLRDISLGISECARHYAEFRRLGANIHIIDVGGGLGINYDGTHSRNFCSMNYSVEDYAGTIVKTLAKTCRNMDLPYPDIITESGRALTAHHAVLITNVVDTESVDSKQPILEQDTPPAVLSSMEDIYKRLTDDSQIASAAESYHDASQHLQDVHRMYISGELSLHQHAYAEKLYASICWRARNLLEAGRKSHRELLDELNEKLADKYFCNFSIFQSIPDVWAIEQIFPIVPVHRLKERPRRRGRIHDITCDSDGRIDNYVDGAGVESSLPLHETRPGEEYLLGIFLVGAYQEILGDIHNLFGDTNSVNVVLTPDGGHNLEQATHGDTVSNVLESVKYNPQDLLSIYEQRIADCDIKPQQKQHYLEELRAGISGYTYLED